MYSFCLCILIVVYVFLLFIHVFLLLSMYSYCSSMYSYRCVCLLIVVYVFLDAATLTEVFPSFFLGCKANARVKLAKTGHGPHSSKIVVLFYVVLYRLCVYVYCTLPPGDNPIVVNKYIIPYIIYHISYIIYHTSYIIYYISYHISYITYISYHI